MRFNDRAATLIRRCGTVLDEGGILALLKQGGLFLVTSFFNCQRIIIYENDFKKMPVPNAFSPKLENLELHIIYSVSQIEKLMKDGYDFSFYTNLKVDKDRLNRGVLFFGVFVNKEIAHKSWVAVAKESALWLAPYLKQIGYEGEVIIEDTASYPKYRGMGIYPYVYTRVFAYAQQIGKSKVRFSSSRSNLIVRKTQERLGSKISHQGYHIRLLYLWDFYLLQPTSSS